MTQAAALAAFTVVLGAAPAASAATVRVVFEGTVSAPGFDNSGLFGPAQGDITDAAFRAVFTTKTTPTSVQDTGTESIARGGATHGLPELMSAVLTINGLSYVMGGAERSEMNFGDLGSDDYVSVFLAPGNPLGFEHFGMVVFGDFLSSHSFTDAFSVANPGGIGYGNLSLVNNNLSFNITSASGGTIPEPATWALMIGGFGLTGVALRRRTAAIA